MTKLQRLTQNLILPTKENGYRALLLKPGGILSIISLLTVLHLVWISTSLSQESVLGVSTNLSSAEVIALTNQARLQNGLDTLIVNQSLSNAALKKAEHMLENDYWSHEQAGITPWKFIDEEDYFYQHAGENLAKDFVTAEDVVVAWLNSPTHSANLLSDQYTQIGVAVVEGEYQGKKDTTLIVQLFGTPYTGESGISPDYQTAGLLSSRRPTNWVHEYPSYLLIVGSLIGSAMTVILVLDITKDGKLDGKFGPRFTPPSHMWHD